ncbi:MAG: hypothetical protein KatS3mg096_074 [Candidatus Parcubacteria bacterium]|nr:MAG: hypothetical protein KatS3mg096_074 [Candidatus Parcubacteria bacterium]
MIDPITFILRFLFDFWWFFLPILFFQILWDKYTGYKRSLYLKQLKWSFLEIKFPSGITRNPRAMEEVFNSLHSIHPDPETDLTWYNLKIKGFVPVSYTFLIIAHDGKLRFFIRFPSELKEFIKTRFYSQYPQIQFIDSEDPLGFFPPAIPNSLFDGEIFDARLNKEDAYPIKTFSVLEYLPKEQQIDPLTTFSEAAWQISNKEWLIFQIFVLPTTPDNSEHGKKWIERGQKIVNKMIGKKEEKEQSIWEEVREFIFNLLLAPFRQPTWKTKEEKSKEEFNIQKLTPGERRVLELIQQKLGKLGFWCNFRISYLATKDIFNKEKQSIIALISSTLKNFSTEDLNGFSLYPLTMSAAKMSPKRIFLIKRREYAYFKGYRLPALPQRIKNKLKPKNLDSAFILNSEELATLFHPPMEFVPPSGIERTPVREIPPSPEIPLPEL